MSCTLKMLIYNENVLQTIQMCTSCCLCLGNKNKKIKRREREKGPLTLVSWGTTGVRHVTNE